MRPPKRILLIDSDEDRKSLRRYLLRMHGITVISVTPAEAYECLLPASPDAIVCGYPLADADTGELLERLWLTGHTASVLIAEKESLRPEGVVADFFLLKGHCDALSILECIKMATARKRGPRKPIAAAVIQERVQQRRIA